MSAVPLPPRSAQSASRRCAVSGAFAIAFQPIVDLARREVFAYEALGRRAGSDGAAALFAGLDAPARADLERRLARAALRAAAHMPGGQRLSINLGSSMLGDPIALHELHRQAQSLGLDGQRIVFEFPESCPIARNAWSRAQRSLRDWGYATAIDDFGAGYAGLALLADCPPDLLKIDIGLVRGIAADRPRQVIVAGLVSIAAQLGIALIAEGVETQADAAQLKAMGIVLQQGYLYARAQVGRWPQPAPDVWAAVGGRAIDRRAL
ncbi:EAL domain-containing protein [Lysobacter sp. BMK333-48F3]|uniref:EAL domain-containing protein n=1 Tax=Lysobacter sp. BMK333-48F3 TaxID=2867962 RepID=UPI001C8C748D|nr:EAL domain-containing protein [Lysobacter sp. BMK333-48F3]MBX9402397.1 EAL domain-containing protein [Lysobacter sp. BMK333-48F3]